MQLLLGRFLPRVMLPSDLGYLSTPRKKKKKRDYTYCKRRIASKLELVKLSVQDVSVNNTEEEH